MRRAEKPEKQREASDKPHDRGFSQNQKERFCLVTIAKQRWLPTYMCFYYHHLQSYSMRHHIICTLILEPVGPVTGTLHGDGHVCVYMCVCACLLKWVWSGATTGLLSPHTHTLQSRREELHLLVISPRSKSHIHKCIQDMLQSSMGRIQDTAEWDFYLK